MITGIHAPAQSGKTTLSMFLLKHSAIKEYALSKPIKDILEALFSWDDRHRDGELKEIPCKFTITQCSKEYARDQWNFYGIKEKYDLEFNDEFDKFMSIINPENYSNLCGTVSPRQAYQNFGTDYARVHIDARIWLDMAPKNCLISDVRFENEAEYIRNNGRLIFLKKNHRKNIHNTNHASEKGIIQLPCDYVIENNGSIKDLENEALKYIEEAGINQ